MIEHLHWKRKFREGIAKQHIAVVGYSHYGTLSKDTPDFTNWAVEQFISGKSVGAQFFAPIQSYFGIEDRAYFWNRVHFFNFVPMCFAKEDKFATGESDVHDHARERFTKILKAEKPDKVFIFSSKAWRNCPKSLEEDQGTRCIPLKVNRSYNWGTYALENKKIRVCGFRHPLFAKAEDVQPAVLEFLQMP